MARWSGKVEGFVGDKVHVDTWRTTVATESFVACSGLRLENTSVAYP